MLPAAKLGPPVSAEPWGSAVESWQQDTAKQSAPTRVRGGARSGVGLAARGGSALPAPRPGARGTHRILPCASGGGGTGVTVKTPQLGRGSEGSRGWAGRAGISWECFNRKVLPLSFLHIEP